MHGTPPLSALVTPPPPRTRQSKQTLRIAGGVVGCVVIALFVVWRSGPRPMLTREAPERPIPEATVMGPPTTSAADLRMVTSYNRQPLSQPEPIPSTPRQDTPPVTRSTGVPDTSAVQTIPPTTPVTTSGARKPPSDPPKPGTPLRQPPQRGGQPGDTTQASPRHGTEGQAPSWRWYTPTPTTQSDIMEAPFKDEEPAPAEEEKSGRGAPQGQVKGKESRLFPKAVWERPLDPTKVLYADQLIQGQLKQNVNSDIPGTVRILVTESVMDRWGLGHTLIPMDTTFMGRQEGVTTYGQEVIPVQMYMAILPNGSAIAFDDGQLGDQGGAAGMPGKVNNHYLKLFGGVLASVAVNIGVRAPFGSTQGFQPNLAQEYSQDAAQRLGQSFQDILKRELAVRPTITQKHGFPVTVQFSKNVSFQTPPIVVAK